MSDEANTAPEANTVPEVKKTTADRYADFIGKQAREGFGSPFDSKGMKPVSREDIAKSTGKS